MWNGSDLPGSALVDQVIRAAQEEEVSVEINHLFMVLQQSVAQHAAQGPTKVSVAASLSSGPQLGLVKVAQTEDCEIQGALVVTQQVGGLPIECENGDLAIRRDGVKALNHGEASKEVVAVEEGRVHQVLSRR